MIAQAAGLRYATSLAERSSDFSSFHVGSVVSLNVQGLNLEQKVLIQELTSEESLELLARTRFGRLGCAQGGQPYVVPFYFGYQDDCLYSFSTVGRKIEWMRANPLVCVEADEVVSSEKWASVIVFGRYEEIPDTPDAQSQRKFAHDLLTQKPIWWEPGYVKTILHGAERPLVPVYFRIHVVEITGHRATP